MKSFYETLKIIANMWLKLNNEEKKVIAFLVAGNKNN
jgi:hypothetical protein